MSITTSKLSTMDAPSGQRFRLEISHNSDTIHHVKWVDPAGPITNSTFVTVAVDNNDGLINLPYADGGRIANIMLHAQALVTEVKNEESNYEAELQLANELETMLKEYRGGFQKYHSELHEMLVEDDLAQWRAIGPEDKELFATTKLTGE